MSDNEAAEELPDTEISNTADWKAEVQRRLLEDNFNRFIAFNSIDRHDAKGVLADMMLRKSAQNVWVGTEKVHGANFQMVTNGVEVKYGKRTSYLDITSSFNNFQSIMPEYDLKMLDLFAHIQKNVSTLTLEADPEYDAKFDLSDIKTVRVYGELYGGLYPHPEVPKIAGTRHIQKGVYYSPNLLFYAFDLRVGTQFLSYAKASEVFEAVGIPYAKPIVKGTLEEVLQFNVEDFESTIPASLGLPSIKDNIAEGLVIRQFDTISHKMVKKKADKFSERTGGNVSQPKPKKEHKENEDRNPEVFELRQELKRYFNSNRLDSVVSKEDSIKGPGDLKQLVGKLATDALKDFQQDFYDRLEALPPKEKKAVLAHAGKYSAALISDDARRLLGQ
eukprot:TRINITY_DN958_c0_g1_i1.p1 TRINITY_DN958_c0_g1~~TRINITY_DN958_c0_g1_i1.p1  ORF type:complete len:390 (-),score=114.68 TRINITY_DN958_c0_g1_i1:32-1201(-)